MGRLQAIRFLALVALLPWLAAAEENAKSSETFFDRSKKEVSRLIDFFSRSWVDGDRKEESRGRGIDVQAGQSINPLEILQQSQNPNNGQTEQGDVVQNGQVVEPDQEDKTPPRGNPSGGPPPKSGRAQTSPYWLPYCFLIDPQADPAVVNGNIKKIVDEYGSCGIAVEAFAFTIEPGYPQDYEILNTRARQACDFGRAFVVRGAIQMMTNSQQIPGQMCGENDAPGCSTLCERLSVSQLAPNANATVALHESLHSNCCGRLCVNEGEGTQPVGYAIELAKLETPVTRLYHAEPNGQSPTGPLNDAPEGGDGGDIGGGGGGARPPDSLGGTLPPEVCDTLRQGAAPNDGTHRWDPNKRNFYARATDPAAQKPLDGTSFFAPKPRFPPGSDHPAGAKGEGGGGNTAGGAGRIGFDDTKAKNGKVNGTTTAGTGATKKDALTEALIAVADGRHRGIPVDGTTTSLLKGLKAAEERGDPAGATQFTNPLPQAPPVAGGGGGGAGRIGFDDSRKKGANLAGGSRGPASGGSAAASPAMGPGGGLGGSSGFGDGSGGGSGGAYGGGGGDDFTRIIGAGEGVGGNSLDGNFFQSIGQGAEAPAEEPRQRGGSLRDRDQAALKRDSQTFQKRTDVLTSSRPDPNRAVDTAQPPMPGTY